MQKIRQRGLYHQRKYWNALTVGCSHDHDEDDGCSCNHRHPDDDTKWKQFLRYWPFVRGIHRSPVNSVHKGQWRGALMLSLSCAWMNGWVNNGEAGDLRRPLWRHCNAVRVCNQSTSVLSHLYGALLINTLRTRQNGRYLPDDIFKGILLNENVWILIIISLKFLHNGLTNNMPTLIQIMACRRPGDKPLSEPMMVNLLTHIYIYIYIYTYIHMRNSALMS